MVELDVITVLKIMHLNDADEMAVSVHSDKTASECAVLMVCKQKVCALIRLPLKYLSVPLCTIFTV